MDDTAFCNILREIRQVRSVFNHKVVRVILYESVLRLLTRGYLLLAISYKIIS